MAASTVLLATAGASTSAGPTIAQFAALHAAQCSDHAARAKKLRCNALSEEPTKFSCSYKLPEPTGSWKKYNAIVAIDGANWIWLDGETRCYVSAISNLN